MQIDPGQPIMFDSDAPPGRGTGVWQFDPGRSDWDSSTNPRGPHSAVRSIVVFAIVIGVMATAALDMFIG